MCSAASEKEMMSLASVSHDNVREHMAHNKFNMNVNEAQIKGQHWMGRNKEKKSTCSFPRVDLKYV